MTRKRKLLLCGVALILVAAIVIKWRVDVSTLERSRSFARLRLADKYDIAMARSSGDLETALGGIDEEIGKLNSLWFGPSDEAAEVRSQWEEYRQLVAAEVAIMRPQ